MNQVLVSNFGDELTYTDWARLGSLSSRLGRDLVVTESVSKILRWRYQAPGNIQLDNFYIQ